MITVTAGDAVTLVFPILVNGEYTTPDAGSVYYSLRDNTGALVSGQTQVALTNVGTDAFVNIASTYNAKVLTTEIRTVILKFTVGSHPYQLIQAYRITDWLNITAVPEDVRRLFAFSRTELPDEDVDFYEAYLILDETLGGTILSNALSSGTIKAKYANDALTYRAAFDLLPSAPLRALRKEAAGTASYERFSHVDFTELHDKIVGLLEEATLNITGATPTYPPMLVKGSRMDVIGGPYGPLMVPRPYA